MDGCCDYCETRFNEFKSKGTEINKRVKNLEEIGETLQENYIEC